MSYVCYISATIFHLEVFIMVRKLFATLLLVVLCVCTIAEASNDVIGVLMVYDNDNPEEQLTEILRGGLQVVPLYVVGVDMSKTEMKYYDSLMTMMLALEKGEIDYLGLPRDVGRYVLENNTDLALKGISWYTTRIADSMNFAFLEKNAELVKKFNEAIAAMTKDGTLAILEKAYINNYGLNERPAVKFEKFGDAETITVALTGDQPPIDYVDAGGTPAGFNVAVLAEIGRRLHVNIRTIQVETGARLAALTSGRADAAFWFRENLGAGKHQYILMERPKGIIISDPYYAWNEYYIIGKK